MRQEFKKTFYFTKRLCITQEAVAFLYNRLTASSLERLSVTLELVGSRIYVESLDDLNELPISAYSDAQEIAVRFHGPSYVMQVYFCRSNAWRKDPMWQTPSWASVDLTDANSAYLFKALIDEFEAEFSKRTEEDCAFVSTMKDEDQLAKPPAAVHASSNSKTNLSTFTASVRPTERLLLTGSDLAAMISIFDSFGFENSISAKFETGEERRTSHADPTFIADHEWKQLKEINVHGCLPTDISGERVYFGEDKNYPGRFSLVSRSKESLELRRLKLTAAFSTSPVSERGDDTDGETRPRQEGASSGRKFSVVAIVTVVCAVAGIYLSARQNRSAATQADSSVLQTAIMAHADQARLTLTHSFGPGKNAMESTMSLDIRNIGKSAATDLIIQCGWPESHGAAIPIGSIGVGEEVKKTFPIDLDRTNPVREPERECLSEALRATYRDDAGSESIRFDRYGNPEEQKRSVTTDEKRN